MGFGADFSLACVIGVSSVYRGKGGGGGGGEAREGGGARGRARTPVVVCVAKRRKGGAGGGEEGDLERNVRTLGLEEGETLWYFM